jgi:hypothetical protein
VAHLERERALLERAAHTVADESSVRISGRHRHAYERVSSSHRVRARLTEQDLVAIATRYVIFHRRGERRPVKRIARELGISEKAARDRVARARELGYLTKGQHGRAGAEPGPLLRDLGYDERERRADNACGATWSTAGQKFVCGRERGHAGNHIDYGDGLGAARTRA